MDVSNILWTFLGSVVGGLLSGGLVVGWIEVSRHRREQKEWREKDKKVDLQVISADSLENRWVPYANLEEKERLRIFEKKLDGKIHQWNYLVKLSITNLTDRDLLALSVDLDVPQPEITIAQGVDAKGMKMISCGFMRYDLLKKDVIESSDLPLVLPAKQKIGVVFSGYYEFDHPQLVDKVPNASSFCIKLDDGSIHQKVVPFKLVKLISDAMSFDDPLGGLTYHWIPFMSKHMPDALASGDDIPF